MTTDDPVMIGPVVAALGRQPGCGDVNLLTGLVPVWLDHTEYR